MGHYFLDTQYRVWLYISANLYRKSPNLPNTDVRNYSLDLRSFLRHPVEYKFTIHLTVNISI